MAGHLEGLSPQVFAVQENKEEVPKMDGAAVEEEGGYQSGSSRWLLLHLLECELCSDKYSYTFGI